MLTASSSIWVGGACYFIGNVLFGLDDLIHIVVNGLIAEEVIAIHLRSFVRCDALGLLPARSRCKSRGTQ